MLALKVMEYATDLWPSHTCAPHDTRTSSKLY